MIKKKAPATRNAEAAARLADDDRVIAAQRELLQAQHRTLSACADALHEMRRALGAYAEVKTDWFPRTLRKGESA